MESLSLGLETVWKIRWKAIEEDFTFYFYLNTYVQVHPNHSVHICTCIEEFQIFFKLFPLPSFFFWDVFPYEVLAGVEFTLEIRLALNLLEILLLSSKSATTLPCSPFLTTKWLLKMLTIYILILKPYIKNSYCYISNWNSPPVLPLFISCLLFLPFPGLCMLGKHSICELLAWVLGTVCTNIFHSLFLIALLVHVKYCDIVVLIGIFLMTSDVEHIFLCLLDNYLFKSFAYFKSESLLLNCKSSYIVYVLLDPYIGLVFLFFFFFFEVNMLVTFCLNFVLAYTYTPKMDSLSFTLCLFLYPSFCFFLSNIMELRPTSNFWFSCLHLPRAGIIGIHPLCLLDGSAGAWM